MIPTAKQFRMPLENNTDIGAAACTLMCWAGTTDGADIQIKTDGNTAAFVVNSDWCTAHGQLKFSSGGTDHCPLGSGTATITHAEVGTTCNVNSCPPDTFTVTVTAITDQSWTSGTPITNITAHATTTAPGGTIASWAISPALPTGVTLNNTTGVISGTPSVTSTQKTYTLTATDSTGSTGNTTFKITVS